MAAAKPVVLHAGEGVSAVNVDVGIAQGRQPGNVGVDVASVPQDDGVQDEAVTGFLGGELDVD